MSSNTSYLVFRKLFNASLFSKKELNEALHSPTPPLTPTPAKKRIGKSDDVDNFLGSVHLMEGSHMYSSVSFLAASVKKHQLHKGWKIEIPTVPGK